VPFLAIGYVRLVDWMGDDLSVTDPARESSMQEAKAFMAATLADMIALMGLTDRNHVDHVHAFNRTYWAFDRFSRVASRQVCK